MANLGGDRDAGPELDLLGVTLDGRFRIDRFVARGGFGVVYRATQLNLGREVAIKVATPPATSEGTTPARFTEDFLEEARIIARFQHPNIAHVYDSGVTRAPSGEPVPWMALEWLDGVTLRDDLAARRGRGGRSFDEAMALFRPVLDAVAYAHDRNVVHRDLKPANIMLVDGPHGVAPKVLDFGIAKELDPEVSPGSGATATDRSAPAFTRTYGTPEQFWRAQTTKATDVYALALILTELLVDAPAYASGNELELAGQAMSPERPTPRRFGVDVGEAVERVLRKALATMPKERHPDARALRDALEGARRGAPAAVKPARRDAGLVRRATVVAAGAPLAVVLAAYAASGLRAGGTASPPRGASVSPEARPRVVVAPLPAALGVAPGAALDAGVARDAGVDGGGVAAVIEGVAAVRPAARPADVGGHRRGADPSRDPEPGSARRGTAARDAGVRHEIDFSVPAPL